jgi:hypothetical protein
MSDMASGDLSNIWGCEDFNEAKKMNGLTNLT